MHEKKSLARRPEDGMIAGVAAGVAETYGIDVTLVRLAFVVLAVISGGVAVVAYLLAAVLMPREASAPGVQSVKHGVSDLVSKGKDLYGETRKVIDRNRPAATMDAPTTSEPFGAPMASSERASSMRSTSERSGDMPMAGDVPLTGAQPSATMPSGAGSVSGMSMPSSPSTATRTPDTAARADAPSGAITDGDPASPSVPGATRTP